MFPPTRGDVIRPRTTKRTDPVQFFEHGRHGKLSFGGCTHGSATWHGRAAHERGDIFGEFGFVRFECRECGGGDGESCDGSGRVYRHDERGDGRGDDTLRNDRRVEHSLGNDLDRLNRF